MRIGDIDVPGHDLLVSASLKIKCKDMGGNTSASDRAHLGYEPKALLVSVKIKYSDSGDLTRLCQLAEQLDNGNKPKVYNIVYHTAAAMNIRQVQFTEYFRVREDESLHQWQVSFELAEYRSVAEKVEQRQPRATAQQQQAAGTAVAENSQAGAASESLTGFEQLLSKIDKVLAPGEAQ